MIFVTQSNSCSEVASNLRARVRSILVRSSLNRVLRVRATDWYIVCLGTGDFNPEGNAVMD